MRTYLHSRGEPHSAKRTSCGLSTYMVQYVCKPEELLVLKTPPAPPCPECSKKAGVRA